MALTIQANVKINKGVQNLKIWGKQLQLQQPVIKWFPPCLTSTSLFAWLGFIPFGQVWIEDLGLTVALSFFSIA